MDMEREIIKITPYLSGPLVYDYALEDEDYENCYDENGNPVDSEDWKFWNDFEWISEKITYIDFEKAYSDKRTIVKRLSTNQYFECEWCDCPYCYSGRDYPTELIEVFPKEKTIVVYE